MGINSFIRFYSTNSYANKSSKIIRKEFVEYFANDLGHSILRSSPVLPIFDGTVSFINSGMNQFKGIFLDYYEPSATKVVNSQKCIRVGGKHNDLNVVGTDTYHHTFFEMLGNWSFGNYFKEKACRYAWDLLTGPYDIQKEFLYVTYFNGDKELGLEPDLECRDIWLSLGVPKDRVLPFGMKDNFWEMGVVGPCGPCTEIHIDNTKQLLNQASKVNQGCADLTELWNIVFMQYERLPDNSIKPLPKCHVDTGMGLERLVALLQGKKSNYDTDLFVPLFEKIQKCSNAPEYKGIFSNDENDVIDRAYRTLADHARMITVAIADDVLPEENQKLRRVLRKALDISRDVFRSEEILPELTFVVAESLGEVYPEIGKNLEKVQRIIRYEKDLFETLKTAGSKEWKNIVKLRPELKKITHYTTPGLLRGYQYLQTALKDISATDGNDRKGILPGNVAFKLYDNYGLTADTIAELAEVERLSFDKSSLDKELSKLAYLSKIGGNSKTNITCQKVLKQLGESGIPKTDDSLKYYTSWTDQYPPVDSKLLGIINNGVLLSNKKEVNVQDLVHDPKDTIAFIVDKTPFYSQNRIQASDKGIIKINDLMFHVQQVTEVNGWILHFGHFPKFLVNSRVKLKPGDDCHLQIDRNVRIGTAKHQTALHLLHACLKEMLNMVYEKNSTVTDKTLKFHYHSFGERLTDKQLVELEARINGMIHAGITVNTKILNSLELLATDDVVLTPGEIYPHTGIRLVEICGMYTQSRKACYGTHVQNTKAIDKCYIMNHSFGNSTYHTITAVVEPHDSRIRRVMMKIRNVITELRRDVNNRRIDYATLNNIINEMKRDLVKNKKLSHVARIEFLEELNELSKSTWETEKTLERDSIVAGIDNAISSMGHPFVIYTCGMFEHHSMNEVTSLYPTVPIMIIAKGREIVKAQCTVPEKMISENFNASKWMQPVLEIFNGVELRIKNQDIRLGVNMKYVKMPRESMDPLIKRAVEEATRFALAHLGNSKVQESQQ